MVTEAYPLQWPAGFKRTPNPYYSRFGSWNNKPSVAKARDKVSYELDLMGAKGLIISSNMKLKKDGMPYSVQPKFEDKGIAVYFTYKGSQQVIACDTYDRLGCNLWAIAKTIEAMRGIERWGASEFLERAFMGFKALPEKASEGTGKAWYEVLGIDRKSNKDEVKKAYRTKSMRYHPDGSDPNPEMFHRISRAYKTAEQLFQ